LALRIDEEEETGTDTSIHGQRQVAHSRGIVMYTINDSRPALYLTTKISGTGNWVCG